MARHLTLPRLWAAAVLVCVYLAASFTWVYPADFWWHLRYGELTLAGATPDTDPFTFTRGGQPYPYGYWLSDAVLALAYQADGLAAVALLNALLFTGGYGLLLAACRQAAGGGLRAASAATAGAFALSVENWTARPQSFSVLLAGAVVWLLARYGARGRKAWLLGLPAVIVLWAYSHGAFLVGLLLAGTWTLGFSLDTWQERGSPPRIALAWAATGAAAVAAALATPLGVDRVVEALRLAANPSVRLYALEWGPTTLATAPGLALAAASVATVVLTFAARRRPPLALLVPGVALGAFGWLSLRSVIWAGFGLAPLWAWSLSHAAGRPAGPEPVPRPRLAAAVAFGVAALAVAGLPQLRPHLPLPAPLRSLTPPDMPQAAADTLAAASPARVFADMQWASYLAWRLPADRNLFIDPRFELFPPALWEQYGTISGGFALHLLDEHRVDAVLAHQERQRGLVERLAVTPGWRALYQDRYSSLWVRTP